MTIALQFVAAVSRGVTQTIPSSPSPAGRGAWALLRDEVVYAVSGRVIRFAKGRAHSWPPEMIPVDRGAGNEIE